VTLLELAFHRKKAKTEASGMLDKAYAESRTLSVAEQVRFDGLMARIQDLNGQIAQRESLRKAVTT
jgi:hypothetical protein